MSKARNTLFLKLICYLKYSLIILTLISLPEVQSGSEIKLTFKCSGTYNRQIIGSSFNTPTKVYINGNEKDSGKTFQLQDGLNDVTLIYNEDIDSYHDMFNSIKNIQEVTLVSLNTKKPTSMFYMFYGTDFQKIMFKEIDTSKVTNMDHLFSESKSLVQVDLSKFNTSSVTNMHSMFRYCEKLKVIEAGHFDTSKVTNMYDIFGYCKELVYINLTNFDITNAEVIQGMFISDEKLKYLDISHFNYTTIIAKSRSSACSSKGEDCTYHYMFANTNNLICLNVYSMFIDSYLEDHTFDNKNSNLKCCADVSKIFSYKDILKDNCDEQCFKDMANKNLKFDLTNIQYVEKCDEDKFEYNNLCWDDCPYNYYRIITDRRRCLEEQPGESYILDTSTNIYVRCYESCQICSQIGNKAENYCTKCIENYSFMNTAKDIYAVEKNCYSDCPSNSLYYFKLNGEYYEYFCEEECPSDYKLISEKNKCIDDCNHDNKYTFELDNTCVEECPKGTVNKNNKCEYCYETCGACTEVGDEAHHQCTECKNSNFDMLNNDNNCYEICANYYYFDKDGKYQCLKENVCPKNYKLIHSKNKCIDECKKDAIFEYHYEYNGECYEKCDKGYYTKDDDDDYKICYCMTNTTCKDCSKSAIEKKLCSSCNNALGYYHKKEESSSEFKNCYDSSTIPANYILNSTMSQYEPCYESCGTCSEVGDETEHKCTLCVNSTYDKLKKDSDNCYKICSHYYYFDDNGKYVCLEQDECPTNYKLINSTNKCIKECKNDDMFGAIYEYDGRCYKNCPLDSYTKDGKEICKCMTNITCQDCPSSGNDNNLCKTCNTGYYPKIEESNNDYKNCYNSTTIPSNYFLNLTSSQYEPCYDSCGECEEKGTDSDHKCTKCKEGYSDLTKNSNCYEICSHYYYFDDNGKYVCLKQNDCPTNYKLINSTNKCIKECKNDDIFGAIYEYNGGCYKNCPLDSYTKDGTEICKCMTNVACQDCPSSNNPNNYCSVCNTGYYPKSEDVDSSLKNCYNDTTKPENYILTEGATSYEACYNSCQTCEEIGGDSDHKCLTCKTGYTKEKNPLNCEQLCDYYFYYKEDETLICTEKEECPEGYSKLIDSSTKCITNCADENLYEYNNKCYEKENCVNGVYKNGDVDSCKCMSNIACKECPFTGDENTLCYSCNNDEKYYAKEDEESNPDGLITCYNKETIPKNYFLNSETLKYEICYESCGSCTEKGNKEYHKCDKCLNETYEKLNNDNNCYETCAHYYYFDENKEYICLKTDECPQNYKLISGTNKCILKCKNDNIFNSKFEYNGKCYAGCSKGFYTDNDINICKCESNVACRDCPYSDSGNNLCSTCNTGYYPKKDEEVDANGLRNCYNSESITSNYLLISGQYERCYDSCATCKGIGTEEEHKCIDCISGYIRINNGDNCYENCNYYYYFDEDDSNKYKCSTENKCPDGYKLISSTKRCIKNCKAVDKYEYNSVCETECPEYWTDTDDDHVCKLDCPVYYNYQKTGCISTIPTGYYLQDSENKYIGKCHDNCEECETGPTENNNNCKKCKTEGTIYFDFGNCRENCDNGNYIDENSVKKCKCSYNIACEACNENGKCLTCNNELGYYQLEESDNKNSEIIECAKDPEGYYLSENIYKKCSDVCKSCSGAGDDKCIECSSQYEKKNDFEDDTKCYKKCVYNYYYGENKDIICTNEDNCPSDMKFIESKKRCIDACKNDNTFKFEFNGKCYTQCPDNTQSSSEDSNVCEEIEVSNITEKVETNECSLKFNEFYLGNSTLTIDELNNLTKTYASIYGDSGNYIIKLENEYYKIYIYNNLLCLQNVSQEAKWTYFDDSFMSQIKSNNRLYSDPIISVITNKTSNQSTYAFANPTTGELLTDIDQNLRRTEVQELEDIYSLLSNLDEKRREYIINMLKQEINLFDSSNDFYLDLCFHYDSPNNKDIPMRDRAEFFFANIYGCESSRCVTEGIDYKQVKFICNCQLEGFTDENTQGGPNGKTTITFPKKKTSLNIEVFKCIKDVFNNKYFKSCAGGIIMLILSFGQIACMILYFVREIKKIKNHALCLYQSFKKFPQGKANNDLNPPKKTISNNKVDSKEQLSSKSDSKKDIILVNTINKETSGGGKYKKESNKFVIDIKEYNEEEKKINKETVEEKFNEVNEKDIIGINGIIEDERVYIELINKYINPEFDEYNFDDVIEKDKRTFKQYLIQKMFNNQIFIKTFYIKHIFKPLSLKIMLLVMLIELYFVITALFYTETYLSERFYSDEKESFLSFIQKRLDKIIFTAAISGIIGYFCTYFFDNDDYLKRILTNKIKGQVEKGLTQFIKNIKRKFIILIVISITITIFSFFYIACFNIVYPYIKREWLKSSIIMLILMQILNLLSTLLGTCCRYLSIKWNNIKLFRLSLNLD